MGKIIIEEKKETRRSDTGERAPYLIDSHCHLDFSQFNPDRGAVLKRALAAGVTTIINPGTDLASSRRAVTMAQTFGDHVYAAVGVHPHDASSFDQQTLAALRELAAHDEVVAIGEIGLDYYRDRSPRDQQRAAFEAQLTVAADLSLPVIVHQREAAADVMAILKDWGTSIPLDEVTTLAHPGCVLHAFSGDQALADEAVQMGFFVGVGGPLTYRNARSLPKIVTRLPLERVLIETDAPYLPPHPHRGQRNEPAYLTLVAQRLAELRGLPLDSLAHQLLNNTRRLFGLPVAKQAAS
jgi:TatD DNase family protein